MYKIIGLLLISLFITGCVVTQAHIDTERKMFTSWGEKNKQQNLALGEKKYTGDYNKIFSAVIIAMSDSGFSVKNMERTSGYILSEGLNPLSADKGYQFSVQMTDELNKISGIKRWNPTPGNFSLSVTMNLLDIKDGQVKIKMRISTLSVKQADTVYTSLYPSMLAEIYKVVWSNIERQIFLDKNLD